MTPYVQAVGDRGSDGSPPRATAVPAHLGWGLFALSAAAIVLMGGALPRFGRPGRLLQTMATGILLARALFFVASGVPRRLRAVPRLLAFVELGADAVATLAGGVAVARHTGSPAPSEEHRTDAVLHVAAVAAFALHTVRLAIYLSPGRGLRDDGRT
jgi:hypothetical protein